MRVLAIAPHPNDETIGPGGSIALHTGAGHQVTIGHLTNGERGSRTVTANELSRTRQAEAVRAAAVLGVPETQVRFLGLPDGGINPHDTGQFTAVTRLLRQVCPDLLYLPHPHDGAFDHEAAFALCWRAAGMAGSSNFGDCGPPYWVPTVLGYEVWQPITSPAYLCDITTVVDLKVTALECYVSQSPAVKGAGQSSQVGPGGALLSAWRGVTTTGGHREAFAVLRLGALL
ncbi:PIG-L deacetylase family protein [Micromonospora sp. NPDC049900]|uniref:PIG-L deacetylase family protein n=1 Tax=Micromonospora sp. NPDC049900 TaxID=3364275 RepID=UPI00378CF9AC